VSLGVALAGATAGCQGDGTDTTEPTVSESERRTPSPDDAATPTRTEAEPTTPVTELPGRTELIPSDGQDGANFGDAVALEGETAVIGASYDEDPDGLAVGSTYIFGRGAEGDGWRRRTKFAPDRVRLQEQSVVLAGDTAVVGAPLQDSPAGSNAGAVYILARRDGSWGLETVLTDDDGTRAGFFGEAVAVSGETAVLTTPRIRGDANGAALVYERTDGDWSRVATLEARPDEPARRFGAAAAFDGDTAVVTATPRDTATNETRGSAYVYARTDDGWTRRTILSPSPADRTTQFGTAVALSGTRLAVGAPDARDEDENEVGAVSVFTCDGTWERETRLVPAEANEFTGFGEAVALAGDRLFVGAPSWVDTAGVETGTVFEYARADGSVRLRNRYVPAGAEDVDRFGATVTVDGETVLVGAPAVDTDGGGDIGAAYLFEP